jgi:hypothetical protein
MPAASLYVLKHRIPDFHRNPKKQITTMDKRHAWYVLQAVKPGKGLCRTERGTYLEQGNKMTITQIKETLQLQQEAAVPEHYQVIVDMVCRKGKINMSAAGMPDYQLYGINERMYRARVTNKLNGMIKAGKEISVESLDREVWFQNEDFAVLSEAMQSAATQYEAEIIDTIILTFLVRYVVSYVYRNPGWASVTGQEKQDVFQDCFLVLSTMLRDGIDLNKGDVKFQLTSRWKSVLRKKEAKNKGISEDTLKLCIRMKREQGLSSGDCISDRRRRELVAEYVSKLSYETEAHISFAIDCIGFRFENLGALDYVADTGADAYEQCEEIVDRPVFLKELLMNIEDSGRKGTKKEEAARIMVMFLQSHGRMPTETEMKQYISCSRPTLVKARKCVREAAKRMR